MSLFRFRFSLRFCLLAMLCAGVICGVVSRWFVAPADNKHDAPIMLNWALREPIALPIQVPSGLDVSGAESLRSARDIDTPAREEVVALSFEGYDQPLRADVVRGFPRLFELCVDGDWRLVPRTTWQTIPGLRSLRMRYCYNTSRQDWEVLLSERSLLVLDVTSSNVPSDVLMSCIRGNEELRVLNLSGIELNERDLQRIGKIKGLVALDLSSGIRPSPLVIGDMELQLDAGPLASYFDFGGAANFRRRGQATRRLALGGLPASLRVLDLAGCQLDSAQVDALVRLPEIELLNLSAALDADDCDRFAATVPASVTHLGLSYTSIADEQLPTIMERCALKELDLRETKVTAAGLCSVIESNRVGQLYVSHRAVAGELNRIADAYAGHPESRVQLRIETELFADPPFTRRLLKAELRKVNLPEKRVAIILK